MCQSTYIYVLWYVLCRFYYSLFASALNGGWWRWWGLIPFPPSTSFCRFYTAVLPIYMYTVETVSTATIVTAVGDTRKYLPTVFQAAYYYTHVISVYSKIHWNPFRWPKSSLYILYTRLIDSPQNVSVSPTFET